MSESERKKRVPFGVPKLTLSVDDDTAKKLKSDNKVARWFNDDEGRIQRALDGGWEFVSNATVKVGTKQESQESNIRKPVGRGRYAYLMAIPRQYYDEDQAAKEEKNLMVDESIRGGQPSGLNHHGISPKHGSSYVKGVDYRP